MSENIKGNVVEAESLEEAGILEADVGAKFYIITDSVVYYDTHGTILRGSGYSYTVVITTRDQQLASIDPHLKIENDPLAHRDLRPEMMFIREELRQAKWQTLAVRRAALKKLLVKDFLQEDCELRNIGLSYAPADP